MSLEEKFMRSQEKSYGIFTMMEVQKSAFGFWNKNQVFREQFLESPLVIT